MVNGTCCQSVLPVASCLTTSATSVTPILEQVNVMYIVHFSGSLIDRYLFGRDGRSTFSPNMGCGVPLPQSHRVWGFQGVKVHCDAIRNSHLVDHNRRDINLQKIGKKLISPHLFLHIFFQQSQNCHQLDERCRPKYFKLNFKTRIGNMPHHLDEGLAQLRHNWSEIRVVGQRKQGTPYKKLIGEIIAHH